MDVTINVKKDKTGANEEEPKRKFKTRTLNEEQRVKVQKLMDNPHKPVIIPEHHSTKDYLSAVPNFVRNVMGSSAGAGSGEFHVYRHLRRKEYARQKQIQSKSAQEKLDEDYRDKLEQNRLAEEAKTAKKRAKRLKKKNNIKMKRLENKQKQKTTNNKTESEDENEDEDADNDDKDNDNDNKMELIDDKINKTEDTVLKKNIENEREKVDSNNDIVKDKNNETNINKETNNIITNNMAEENIENNVLTTIMK